MSRSPGRYVYAICPTPAPGSLPERSGLRGAPLEVVDHHGLSAVVSDVDLEEFGEEGLHRNLEDLAWLEEVARGHDDVVHGLAETGPVAPLRLATIYHDDDGVRSRLREQYDSLLAVLDRITGRHEWSVKAYSPPPDRERAGSSGSPEAGSAGAGAAKAPGAGAAYLKRRKEQVEQRHDAEEQALEVAEQVHDLLTRCSVASRRLQPQDPKLAGHTGVMTLNGAYLVEDSEESDFVGAVDGLTREYPEARISIGGPWPPYSFATLEQP